MTHIYTMDCKHVQLCPDVNTCVTAGLKATFMSSYIHTVYIYVALCIFTIMVYATCPALGSPGIVYDHLKAR